ncbi:carboxylating nicotinate-nucleotide diphosphorylase [Micropruina sonneratiae]|uniref:carboxylating nicotinate-nucleotide diphosphorylase n=1 Tax=Micropruina sonneratiae TaxID=2986940 RepID=UPI00222606DD|nr:carboxylating nicotinate-nucleotide diphosphorylase [Micropruina sp. KQZ13P-5]MCW3159003.1 carboxylating nicotinate-nucleotide diphosphorylase [Micropruina sp. KQZ13P-5]
MRSLPRIVLEPVVRTALLEDLGRAGDLTTDSIVPAGATATVQLVSRDAGVVAGLPAALLAWELVDPTIAVEVHLPDGSRVAPGSVIATASGPARGLLTGERVALNLLGHLSGVATSTAAIADVIAHTGAKVADTRKTIPGLRALQKYAVTCGGGSNHRFGLDDAVLIKDNHIAVAGGVRQAVEAARAHIGHLVKVEVEVDSLSMLAELLEVGADVVLLDNFTPAQLREAVTMVDGAMVTEASGRITPETAVPIAEAGVDLISVGWLTHSARVLDIGLDHLSST